MRSPARHSGLTNIPNPINKQGKTNMTDIINLNNTLRYNHNLPVSVLHPR